MQLGPPPASSTAGDLASALADRATSLGQRPAVTVLGTDGRAEQGYVTLAQWAAKGAHLLITDVDAAPGATVLVDLPLGWQLASVCTAVWWTGAAVTTDPDADVIAAIVHESRPAPDIDPLYVVGDAVDGGITTPDTPACRAAFGSWVEEVQQFPDQPPPHAAGPEVVALRGHGDEHTHAGLVADLTDEAGTLGLDLATWDSNADDAVRLVAARPLVTGRTTVVLTDALSRKTASGDRITRWA